MFVKFKKVDGDKSSPIWIEVKELKWFTSEGVDRVRIGIGNSIFILRHSESEFRRLVKSGREA